jgi:hypothetical protein
MRWVMLIKRTAAILIAVFLFISISGCYTRLKSPKPKLIPDEPEISTEAQWDFGWGWYEPDWYVSNSYYDYYYINWWDECRWCEDETPSAPDIGPVDESGKIPRRGDYDYNPNVQVHPPSNNQYVPTDVIVSPSDPPSPPPPSQPVVQQKQPDNSSNDNGSSDSQSSSNKKITRRGRR